MISTASPHSVALTPATDKPLADFAANVHSQFGEDGIIDALLDRLARAGALDDRRPLFAIEFGAWDGVHLSNARALIERRSAHAVLIETDARRFRAL